MDFVLSFSAIFGNLEKAARNVLGLAPVPTPAMVIVNLL
jgi:hypothetical protein